MCVCECVCVYTCGGGKKDAVDSDMGVSRAHLTAVQLCANDTHTTFDVNVRSFPV